MLTALPGAAQAQSGCYFSGAWPRTLEGRLDAVRFKEKGGVMETALILRLANFACLQASYEGPGVKGTRRIHVVGSNETIQKQLQDMAGKPAVLTGEIMARHEPHHRAPIILNVTSVAK